MLYKPQLTYSVPELDASGLTRYAFAAYLFNDAELTVRWTTTGGTSGPAMAFKKGWNQLGSDYDMIQYFVAESDTNDAEFFV